MRFTWFERTNPYRELWINRLVQEMIDHDRSQINPLPKVKDLHILYLRNSKLFKGKYVPTKLISKQVTHRRL